MASKKDKYARSRLRIRENNWPGLEEELWLKPGGYTSLPRGLSLVTRILDALSHGKPLTSTYLALWCYSQDEMTVTVQKPKQMALESGFGGQRAEYTWRTRIKKLVELEAIKTAEGATGHYHYILLLNPYLVAKRLKEKYPKKVPDILYNTLLERVTEIGEKTEL